MKKRRRISQCPNCLNQLNPTDNFCSECGQENHLQAHSIKEIWRDFTGAMFNFDGKFWNTLKVLFLKPGKIPKDFFYGKRVRYVPPVRMYFFVSFLYFLVLNFGSSSILDSSSFQELYQLQPNQFSDYVIPIDSLEYVKYQNKPSDSLLDVFKENITTKNLKISLEEINHFQNKNAIDSVGLINQRLTEINLNDEKSVKIDSSRHYLAIYINPKYDTITIDDIRLTKNDLLQINANPEKTNAILKEKNEKGIFNQIIKGNIWHYYALFYYGNPYERRIFLSQKVTSFLNYFSYAILIVLPISALLLFLFFFNRYQYFYAHFLQTVYLHIFILILFTVLIGVITFLYEIWDNISPFVPVLLTLFLMLYQWYYFIKALRGFYGQSRNITLLKSIALIALYIAILLPTFAGIILMVFLLE